MTELDTQISSIYEQMQNFLRLQARNEGKSNQPLVFRTEYKTGLKFTDSEKNVFDVDESFLSVFRDVYTDKSYKYVRLNNWEFQIKFFGKKCVKIQLICESITFLATKTIKRQINGCHFKAPIISNQADVKNLSPSILGYLNRLGKKHLSGQSYNVAGQMKSLLSFIATKPVKVQSFEFRPWARKDNEINHFDALNQQGKKVLQKLRHFITRQQIQDFIVEQQVSEQSVFELRKLIVLD